MPTPITAQYTPVLLPLLPAEGDLRRLAEPYWAMIVAQFRAILDRTERSEHYPWIDTKINLITGAELPPAHPLMGRDVVSGWVQGRGLESVATFAAWLLPYAEDAEAARLIERARRLTADLLMQLRQARRVNRGHLHFFMSPDGQAYSLGPESARVPLILDATSPHNYSDLFCAKGMLAAAHLLGDRFARDEARSFCMAVYRDIVSRAFRSDQPGSEIAGAYAHGPHMIALGMAALLVTFEPGPAAVEMGLTLARYILGMHVNLRGRWPDLLEYDLVEYVDAAGRPWADTAGRVLSDPGHSLEFAGLFLKFSEAVRRHGGATIAQRDELREIEGMIPAILARAFANGYRPGPGGICKTVDLRTRRPVDDTMPWWSLPETIRAAAFGRRVAESDAERRTCLEILAQSHNAFVTHYVRPEIHLMAVKVRDANGVVVDLMPSVPDADPGYHTALSLMDALES